MGPVSLAQIARKIATSRAYCVQALAALLRDRLVSRPAASSGGRGPAQLYELNPGGGVGRGPRRRKFVTRALSRTWRARSWLFAVDERASTRASALIGQIGGSLMSSRPTPAFDGGRSRSRRSAAPGSSSLPRTGRTRPQPPRLGPTRPRGGGPSGARHEHRIRERRQPGDRGRQWSRHRQGRAEPSSSTGTGVGAGLVLNGELFRGSSGMAGEIGYVPMAADHVRGSRSRRRGTRGARRAPRPVRRRLGLG